MTLQSVKVAPKLFQLLNFIIFGAATKTLSADSLFQGLNLRLLALKALKQLIVLLVQGVYDSRVIDAIIGASFFSGGFKQLVFWRSCGGDIFGAIITSVN